MKSKADIVKQIKFLAEKRREQEGKNQPDQGENDEENISKNQMCDMSSMNEREISIEDESRYREEDSELDRDGEGQGEGDLYADQDDENEGSQKKTFNLLLMRQYAEGLEDFKKRRARKYVDGKLDLGVLYLQEIVYCLYEEEIIAKQVMLVIKNFSIFSTLDFVKKNEAKNLVDFDFETQKFTIFDHRRICNMLVKKDPTKYLQTSDVYCLPFEAYILLRQIYQMPEEKYEALLQEIDLRFEREWWKSIFEGKKGIYQSKQKPPIQENQVVVEEKKAIQPKLPVPPIRKRPVVKKNQGQQLEEQKKKPGNFSSAFSSSMFESEIACESFTISLGKDSHSISDLSDLFSQSDKGQKKTKKQKKKEKQASKSASGFQEDRPQNSPPSSSFSHPDFSDS